MNRYECDDGNLINGDGCDEECKIEPGWACYNGSPINSDICKPIEMPIIEKSSMEGDTV
jgi:cysteine-rich repeat protein